MNIHVLHVCTLLRIECTTIHTDGVMTLPPFLVYRSKPLKSVDTEKKLLKRTIPDILILHFIKTFDIH